MRGLILAGGSGTRLRPITHTCAKQLVPVANKPILFYGVEQLVAAGVTEIGVIIGDTGDEIRAALGDGSRFGAQITYIAQDAPLGLAHAVLIARDFLGDADVVMYLGDNLLGGGIGGFVEQFEHARKPRLDRAAPAAQILLTVVDEPHRFGIAGLSDDGSHVVHLVEKPDDPPSNLALVGVYLFTPLIHEAVRAIEPSARGELEITDALQWLIDEQHRVDHVVHEGLWIDTGKLQPLLEANRLVLETLEPRIDGDVDDTSRVEGRVVIEAGAKLVNSTVRGPAIIGANTRLTDAYVGPFSSVANDCVIEHSELEHSVVLEHSTIVGVPRINDSLIGRRCTVVRSQQVPRASRLMVGDDSQVDLE